MLKEGPKYNLMVYRNNFNANSHRELQNRFCVFIETIYFFGMFHNLTPRQQEIVNRVSHAWLIVICSNALNNRLTQTPKRSKRKA